jgi:tetratricopeptide (TPR) repeat protein
MTRALLAAALACALLLFGAPARSEEPQSDAAAVRALETIREDLDGLRFEKALREIDELLARPGISDATRVDALGLRASADVASGDLDAAEQDYRRVLALSPAYAPDRSLTPKKALARFEKARAATVGIVSLDLRPKDARITVDGKDVLPQPDGTILVVAGERVIHAERKGFDPGEVKVQVAPGAAAAPVRIALVPNSRVVVLRTDPSDVEVRLDDRTLGRTERGELAVEEVPIGEHVFELTKTCYRTVRLRVLVTVDLVDPSPLALEPVTLAISRSRVMLEGGVAGADVLVDGARVGKLPLETLDVCSGDRRIEVATLGRVLWSARLAIPEGEETRVSVAPRPNAVLLGSDAWPEALASLSDALSISAARPVVPEGADLSVKATWDAMDLRGADLAIAVAEERVVLYSPILRRLYVLGDAPPPMERPLFHRSTIGARLVDSEVGGAARVVEVLPGSPAAAAKIVRGDRIVKIAGADVKDVRQATAAIESQAPGAALALEVASASGASRSVSLTVAASPWLRSGRPDDVSSALLAAWASVDAAASPSDGPAALASLGMLLSRAGQPARAAEALRRVRLGDRPGVGDGTAAYELGRALASLGQEKEAREAFERAAASAATAIADDGPEIKGAAADHLVDLGVARASQP